MRKSRKYYSEATKKAYLASCKESQQSIRDFCRTKGISHATFYKWLKVEKIEQEKKALRCSSPKVAPALAKPDRFIPINLLIADNASDEKKQTETLNSTVIAKKSTEAKSDCYRLIRVVKNVSYSLEIPLSIELDKLMHCFFNASSASTVDQGGLSCA